MKLLPKNTKKLVEFLENIRREKAIIHFLVSNDLNYCKCQHLVLPNSHITVFYIYLILVHSTKTNHKKVVTNKRLRAFTRIVTYQMSKNMCNPTSITKPQQKRTSYSYNDAKFENSPHLPKNFYFGSIIPVSLVFFKGASLGKFI